MAGIYETLPDTIQEVDVIIAGGEHTSLTIQATMHTK